MVIIYILKRYTKINNLSLFIFADIKLKIEIRSYITRSYLVLDGILMNCYVWIEYVIYGDNIF